MKHLDERTLKKECNTIYYSLRELGVSHQVALLAVIETVIKKAREAGFEVQIEHEKPDTDGEIKE